MKNRKNYLKLNSKYLINNFLIMLSKSEIVKNKDKYFNQILENYKNDKDANVWLYGLSSTNNCWGESTWLAKKINLSGNICENIVFPSHIDSRITNQSGCFTIHEIPERDQPFAPLNENPRIFDTFIKITIDKDKKQDILNELYYVGIHRGFIYPGLEGLTSRLKFEIETTHKRTTLHSK